MENRITAWITKINIQYWSEIFEWFSVIFMKTFWDFYFNRPSLSAKMHMAVLKIELHLPAKHFNIRHVQQNWKTVKLQFARKETISYLKNETDKSHISLQQLFWVLLYFLYSMHIWSKWIFRYWICDEKRVCENTFCKKNMYSSVPLLAISTGREVLGIRMLVHKLTHIKNIRVFFFMKMYSVWNSTESDRSLNHELIAI